MPFEATLESFARALRDSSHPPPPQTLGREGRPDARRFAVYRNNVAVGLIAAIEARYPVVRRLVGDDFFRGMARTYIGEEKPATAVLIHYGATFADFLERFEPAREIGYLADVARLENAWVQAYHSAEAATLTLAALGEVAPGDVAGLRFSSHPATRLLRFDHPAASIWASHQGPGEPRPPAAWRAEDALVTRPEADVSVRILPPGGWAFANALLAGAPFGEAANAGVGEGYDAGAHLVGLIEAGALHAIL